MFPYLKHIQLFLRLIRVLKAPFRYLLYDLSGIFEYLKPYNNIFFISSSYLSVEHSQNSQIVKQK